MDRAWKPIFKWACLAIGISAFMMMQVFAVGRTRETNQKSGSELAQGLWGGQHISLDVKPDGASVEYDCAHGFISKRIILDRRGRFSVSGLHVIEHGGPVRADEQSKGVQVQFSGRVTGQRMQLTVKRRGSGKLIGTFSLVFGQEASRVKCK